MVEDKGGGGGGLLSHTSHPREIVAKGVGAQYVQTSLFFGGF